MLENPNDLRSCSLADAFMTIGGKWKPYIVWYLNTAPDLTMRYGELKRHIPWTISHKMYAQQLHELEADGIITRHEYMEGNIRVVDYTLTEAGRFLVPAILYLARLARRLWRLSRFNAYAYAGHVGGRVHHVSLRRERWIRRRRHYHL